MTRYLRCGLVGLASVCLVSPVRSQDLPKDAEFVVQLLQPLSTETSKGCDKTGCDRISAKVVSPEAYQKDYLEGKVEESKKGNKLKGRSRLRFSFETFCASDRAIPISSTVKKLCNSKGDCDVDEEGTKIEKKNQLPKVAGGAVAGAIVGGILGGGKGAVAGAAAGAGATLMLVELTAKAPSVSFASGSQFTLSVRQVGKPGSPCTPAGQLPRSGSADTQ